MAEIPVTTAISTEQGCAYGRDFSTTIAVIEAASESTVQRASDNLHPYAHVQAQLDREAEKAALRLLVDVKNLRSILNSCSNCSGSPETASMTQGEMCPVAKFAIYKMTLPGNAGFEKNKRE